MVDELMLYHYTDSNGLLGIFGEKKIWATDFRFLNDGKEIYYGIDCLLRYLSSEPESGGLRGIFFESLKDKVEAVRSDIEKNTHFKAYVSCFCCDGDLLSQWRGYANYGAGYSIGFDKNALSKPQRYILREVEYDAGQQISCYKEAIDRALNQIVEPAGSVDVKASVDDAIVKLFSEYLLEYFCIFKDAAFSEEKEWRLICVQWGQGKEKTFFRPLKYGIAPYLKVELEEVAIKEVKIGPGVDPVLNKHAINLLASSNGFAIDITPSFIPFR